MLKNGARVYEILSAGARKLTAAPVSAAFVRCDICRWEPATDAQAALWHVSANLHRERMKR